MTLSGMVASLHWQAKIRGPDFTPINFQLHAVTHEELKTTKGKLISTVFAKPLSDGAQEEMQEAEQSEEDLLIGGKLLRLSGECSSSSLPARWQDSDSPPGSRIGKPTLRYLACEMRRNKHS
jgi:hypothetical protein